MCDARVPAAALGRTCSPCTLVDRAARELAEAFTTATSRESNTMRPASSHSLPSSSPSMWDVAAIADFLTELEAQAQRDRR
jgi:hypothetical protein